MALQFDDVRYRKRQLVENEFSVLKRKFGGDLKARIFTIQKKEIAGKMIVCNIHRFLQFLVIEVFYKAIISYDNQNSGPFSQGNFPSPPAFLFDNKCRNGIMETYWCCKNNSIIDNYLNLDFNLA
jgi:hypothetical protein